MRETGREESNRRMQKKRKQGKETDPPTYQDAFFFPVWIVHGEESCHSGEGIS